MGSSNLLQRVSVYKNANSSNHGCGSKMAVQSHTVRWYNGSKQNYATSKFSKVVHAGCTKKMLLQLNGNIQFTKKVLKFHCSPEL